MYPGKKQTIETAFSGIAISLLLAYGLLNSLRAYQLELGFYFGVITFSWLDAVLSSYSLIAFFALSAAITTYKIRKQRNSLEGGNSDRSVTAIIPTYKDSEMLQNSVETLLSANYPNLEAVIVCEEDDEKAIEKCKELSQIENVNYIVNKYSSTKAGALNFAADKTESEVLAFFDCDQRVDENLLSTSVEQLKEYDIVQNRVIPRATDITSSICYFQSLLLNYIPSRLLIIASRYRLAGSRSIVMNREVFEELDGYDERFLTEDMDFTFRCHEHRVKVKENLGNICTEEAPHSFEDWWGQRKRWIKGHIQTFISRIKLLLKEREVKYLKSSIIAGTTVLGSFLVLALVAKFIVLLILDINLLAALLLGTIVFITAFFVKYDSHSLRQTPKLRYTLLAPLTLPLYGLVATKALSEIIFRTDHSWYRIQNS